MKKIKLHAIGNQGNYIYYIFDKKQNVLEILNKILLLDFDLNLIANYDNVVKNKKMNDVKRRIDVHLSDDKNGFRIDIFYGKNRMYVTIVCSESLRLKFNESLFKYATMPKPIKIKPKRKIKW